MAAKALKRDGKMKYVWTRNGIVKMRETDNSPIYTLQDESQLDQWYYENEEVDNYEEQSETRTVRTTNGINSPAAKRTAEERSPAEASGINERRDRQTKKKTRVGVQSSIKNFATHTPYRDTNYAKPNLKNNIVNNNMYNHN